ncbi:ArsR/SmtB family transcription factor [Actinokineospora globicatena]|uniref:ArsR/SmtB family transcription factor n=1 Tax=Actinokineospora globicatena TaxID=103729 RepID=UPI0020A386EE|nr:ArsR family transcriptional regulator [Actinokineospora globicatena]MCP2303807.1 regulatory protein, arsR family [Actinokineospora globicatena]GLW79041.1 transcriptional regulator [Actinokineospora globicatena]GLW86549.1 transcriptional regulator [Actinokineospora globicatena]
MHRLILSSADVARVRLLPSPTPVSETLFSLNALRGGADGAHLEPWRDRVRAGLGPWSRMLAAISPRGPHFLDLVALMGAGVDDDALLAAPRARVRVELDWLARWSGRMPSVLRGLDKDLAVRRDLLASLRAYHDLAIRPEWAAVEHSCALDRATRTRDLADDGVGRLLTGLHPLIRWDGTALEVDSPFEAETALDGRGLDIVPSYFQRSPTLLKHNDRMLLTYPAARTERPQPPAGLAKLLGRTRATVLAAIAEGIATTTALAHHVGTSASAVSQHTAILRGAGLITTGRHRGTACHTLTPTATTLLTRATARRPDRAPRETGQAR